MWLSVTVYCFSCHWFCFAEASQSCFIGDMEHWRLQVAARGNCVKFTDFKLFEVMSVLVTRTNIWIVGIAWCCSGVSFTSWLHLTCLTVDGKLLRLSKVHAKWPREIFRILWIAASFFYWLNFHLDLLSLCAQSPFKEDDPLWPNERNWSWTVF